MGNSSSLLTGASVALTTPFSADGAVDWARLADHAAGMLARGLTTVGAFGTTGEGASIPRAVRAELPDRFARRGIDIDRVVACVYAVSAEDAGSDIAAAIGAGHRAVLVPPPFYYKDLVQDGLFRWFATAFERAGAACRDVILYNIPQLTGVVLDADLITRLRAVFGPVVVGVKDSGGDWDHTVTLIAAHSDIAVLIGHEGHLARAVGLGASGSISGIANVAPGLVTRLAGGGHDPAIDRILEVVLALPVVPAIKAIQSVRTGDDIWRAVRPPLVAFDRDTARRLCDQVARLAGDLD